MITVSGRIVLLLLIKNDLLQYLIQTDLFVVPLGTPSNQINLVLQKHHIMCLGISFCFQTILT